MTYVPPGTYIIVPSLCQGSTLQVLDEGKDRINGSKVVVSERIPNGRKNYNDQLWLWDGETLYCHKHPSYCIHGQGRSDVQVFRYMERSPWQKWTYDNGTLRIGKTVMSLKQTGNNSPIEIRPEQQNDCFWKFELVSAIEYVQPVIPGFGDYQRERTCVISPAMCPGKTVHLDHGRTENGTKIVLSDRFPAGHEDFLSQVWIWDGIHFRSAKDPGKALFVPGNRDKTYVQLMDLRQDARGARRAKNHEWTVKRTPLDFCIICNRLYSMKRWIAERMEFNDDPICIWNYTSTFFWKMEMISMADSRGSKL